MTEKSYGSRDGSANSGAGSDFFFTHRLGINIYHAAAQGAFRTGEATSDVLGALARASFSTKSGYQLSTIYRMLTQILNAAVSS